MSWNRTVRVLTTVTLAILGLRTGLCQQQSFRETPKNTTVARNETTVLKCAVNNRVGAVQWTKDGLTLGFQRSIIGFDNRYSMIGDENVGEYHLQIKNADLGDDAEFQCQVSPVGDVKEIWASARLTVMLPPVTVEIVTKDGNMGGTYVVTQNENLDLTCTVKEGKPAATIKWFRNGYELKIENERYEVENIDGKRQNARSKVRLHPTPDDNGATFVCKGIHPALREPISAQFKLSVQYPPGTPEITGYQYGEVVRMGSRVTLTCVSRGGNPLPQLVWYKDNVIVDHSFTTSGRESVNSFHFEADSSDNGALYACKASNNVTTTPKVAYTNMTVHYAPSKVTVKGPKEAKKNDKVTMKCETGKSYPPTNISWVVEGNPAPSMASVTKKEDDGWITTSEITITVSNLERNSMVFSCYAAHQTLGQTIVDTYSLKILHPPHPPIITGYNPGSTLPAGSNLKLTCTATGGNPRATLKWYKRGKEIPSTIDETRGDIVMSDINVLVSAEDNMAEYQCKASNSATKNPLVASTKINVHFPPTGVNITVSPNRVKAGRKVTLQCDSASSNPEAEITWWRNGFKIESARYNGSQNGVYGGKAARSILKIDTTPSHDNAVYTCQATNKALQHSVHDAVTLNVLYKPEFVKVQSSPVTTTEGCPVTVNLTAKGNPSTIKYKWKIGDKDLTSLKNSFIHSNGPILNITNVTRDDIGNYTCEATNGEGTTVANVYLDVQYSASITKISSPTMVDEGSTVHLECSAEANPKTSNYLTWKREKYNMSRVKQVTKNGRSYLTITNVTRTDSGYFTCVANNGIGAASEMKTTLIVKYKPVIDKTSPYSKAAGDQGSQARLVCRAEGAPNISFSWSRHGQIIGPSTSSSRYKQETRKVDLTTWDGILTFSNIQSKDYGNYECVARNDLGFETWTIKLNGTSAPDPPLALKILNSTHNSVLLGWTPGFDGGLPSSFRIRYKSVDSPVHMFTDVFPRNATLYQVGNLQVGTEYVFSIMAYNDKGDSNYTTEQVQIKTSDEVQPSGKSDIADVLRNKGEIPRIVIITVSVVGTFLLVLNVTLVVCFIRRRHKKRLEDESSEQSSSKAATIEMYAPSSYNGTITGETLSSISEKSETYSEDNVTEDYMDDGCKPSATYLTDPMPHSETYPTENPAYLGYRNDNTGSQHNTLTRPHHKIAGSNMYERPDDFNYADALRKNAYNHNLSDKTIYTKAPPNPPIRSISSKDPFYNNPPETRYVPYPTMSPMPPVLSTFNPNPHEISTTPLVSPQGTEAPPGLLPEMAGHLV